MKKVIKMIPILIFLGCGSSIPTLIKGVETEVEEKVIINFKDNLSAEQSRRFLELALLELKFKKKDEFVNEVNPNSKIVIYQKDTFAERMFLGTGTTVTLSISHPTKDTKNLLILISISANAKRPLEAREKLQNIISEIKEEYNKQ